jgi:hypothetical protein
MRAKPKTIDEYLAGLPADRLEALEKLRKAIKAIVPEAEECISYSMPAFRVDGRVVARLYEPRREWTARNELKAGLAAEPGGPRAPVAQEDRDDRNREVVDRDRWRRSSG